MVDAEVSSALKRAKSMRHLTSTMVEEEMPKRVTSFSDTTSTSKSVEEEVPMPISQHRTLPEFVEHLNEKKVESFESSSQ